MVAKAKDNAPTTANVNVYSLDNFYELQKVTFLDLEGENGGTPPKTLVGSMLTILESMGLAEYQQKRRAAVGENLTRLAFVVSDVTLFISNEVLTSPPFSTFKPINFVFFR